LSHKPAEAFAQNRRSEEVLVDSVETSSNPAVLSVNSEHRHCNTLQHTATHCSTLQHSASHCNILQHSEHAATQQFSGGGRGAIDHWDVLVIWTCARVELIAIVTIPQHLEATIPKAKQQGVGVWE